MEINLYSQYDWSYIDNTFISEAWTNYKSIDSLINVLTSINTNLKWEHLGNWEDMNDTEILEYLSKLNSFHGDLLIITEVSYKPKRGPFGINAKNVFLFEEKYFNNFGERLFNGDVIIVSEQMKTLWIFHHEGLYAALKM